MIRYELCCDRGHRFESWFYDSSAFDEQAGRDLVICPICDSHHVAKAIMAPAVVVRGTRKGSAKALGDAGTAGVASSAPPIDLALVDDRRREVVRAFREKVLAETRDVGLSFADEARRIHASDDDERIRGQATLAEARDLLEDGIMVLPVPTLPDDLN